MDLIAKKRQYSPHDEEGIRSPSLPKALHPSPNAPTAVYMTSSTTSTDQSHGVFALTESPTDIPMSPISADTAGASSLSNSLMSHTQTTLGAVSIPIFAESHEWESCFENGPSEDVVYVVLETRNEVILVKSNNAKIEIEFRSDIRISDAKLLLCEYEPDETVTIQKLRSSIARHSFFEFPIGNLLLASTRKTKRFNERNGSEINRRFRGKISGDVIPPPSKLFGIGRPVVGYVVFQSYSEEHGPSWAYCKTRPFVVVSHVDDTTQGLIGYGVTVCGIEDKVQLFQFIIRTLTGRTYVGQTIIFEEEMQFFDRICKDTYRPDQRDLISLARCRQFFLLSRFSNWMSKMTAILKVEAIYLMWQERQIDGFITEDEAIRRLFGKQEGTYILRFDDSLDEPGNLKLSYVKDAYSGDFGHEKIIVTRKQGPIAGGGGALEFVLKSSSSRSQGTVYGSLQELIDDFPLKLTHNSTFSSYNPMMAALDVPNSAEDLHSVASGILDSSFS